MQDESDNPLYYKTKTRSTAILSDGFSADDIIFECNSKCKCNKNLCKFSFLGTNPDLGKNLDVIKIVKNNYNFAKRYHIKRQELEMWGVITQEDISKNEYVVEYNGEVRVWYLYIC